MNQISYNKNEDPIIFKKIERMYRYTIKTFVDNLTFKKFCSFYDIQNIKKDVLRIEYQRFITSFQTETINNLNKIFSNDYKTKQIIWNKSMRKIQEKNDLEILLQDTDEREKTTNLLKTVNEIKSKYLYELERIKHENENLRQQVKEKQERLEIVSKNINKDSNHIQNMMKSIENRIMNDWNYDKGYESDENMDVD